MRRLDKSRLPTSTDQQPSELLFLLCLLNMFQGYDRKGSKWLKTLKRIGGEMSVFANFGFLCVLIYAYQALLLCAGMVAMIHVPSDMPGDAAICDELPLPRRGARTDGYDMLQLPSPHSLFHVHAQ